MPLSLLVAFLLAPAQAAQQPSTAAAAKVSFEEPAAPLSRILPDLAKATNLPLKLSKAMPNYIIDIAVKDVTVGDLMQKIADTTGGYWDESEHSYYLSPSDGARAKIIAEAQKARAADLAEGLKRMAAPKPSKPSPEETAYDFMSGGYFGNDEFFPKALAAIGAEKLATLLDGDRVVMSTKPLAHQYAFPVGNDQLVAFITRHNGQAAEQMAKAKAQAAQNKGQGNDEDDNDGDIEGAFSTIGEWSKADLVVSRASGGLYSMFGGAGLTCELVFYDGKGQIVDTEGASVRDANGMSLVQEVMEESGIGPKNAKKPQKPETGTPEKDIELSPDTIKFLSVTLGSQPQAENNPLGKKLPKATPADKAAIKARNLRPDLYDPMAYVGDLVTGMAKSKNYQLVACLPDSTFMYVLFALLGHSTPSRMQRQLMGDRDVVCHQADGWFTVSPSDFRITPMDRGDLTHICQDVSSGVTPTIEWRAQAAAMGVGDSYRGPMGMLWLSLLLQSNEESQNGVGTTMMLNVSDWDILHLYGELDDAQKATLAKDKRLLISSLSDSARSLVDRMIFSAQNMWTGRLNVDIKPDKDSLFGPTEQVFEDQSQNILDGEMANDYRAEPTEVAPNGIPEQGALTVRESSTPVLIPIYEKKGDLNPGFYQMAMTPEELGGYVGMMESPTFMSSAEGRYMTPKITGVKIGVKRTFHFRIWVATDTFKSSSVDDYGPTGDQVYSLTNLPADIQAKFNKAKAQAAEMYKDAKLNGGDAVGTGGGVPH